MAQQKINTLEMTRRIRERNYERLRGLSPAKRLEFYREQAHRMNRKAAQLTKAKPKKKTCICAIRTFGDSTFPHSPYDAPASSSPFNSFICNARIAPVAAAAALNVVSSGILYAHAARRISSPSLCA